MSTTADAIMGGRVRLLQPEAGYRAAIDPVLLAAAVLARPGETVLDVGVGTGAAALCLAARVPECRIVGLDRVAQSLNLASASIRLNGFQRGLSLVRADLATRSLPFAANSFDHVMTNPPYLAAEAGSPPAAPSRSATDRESLPLAAWLDACLAPLRFKGSLTIVHRADRAAEIMAALAGKAGGIELYPLWPTADAAFARRVIVRARKGSRAPTKIWRGMVLHAGDGTYTAATDRILRDGAALMMDGSQT